MRQIALSGEPPKVSGPPARSCLGDAPRKPIGVGRHAVAEWVWSLSAMRASQTSWIFALRSRQRLRHHVFAALVAVLGVEQAARHRDLEAVRGMARHVPA